MKKILFLFVMIFGLLFINSCGDTEDSPTSPDGGGSSTTTTLQDRIGIYSKTLDTKTQVTTDNVVGTYVRSDKVTITPGNINLRLYYGVNSVLLADIVLKDGAMSETASIFYYTNVDGEIGATSYFEGLDFSFYYDELLDYFEYSDVENLKITLQFSGTSNLTCIVEMSGKTYTMNVSKYSDSDDNNDLDFGVDGGTSGSFSY